MRDIHLTQLEKPSRLTIFYDGQCPLCRREIAFYRRQKGSELLDWVDVADSGQGMVAPGLSACNALSRFHVMDTAGRLFSGGTAFARLWLELPAFNWFGHVFQNAPMAWILDRVYDFFLYFRPGLQRIIKR